MNPNRIRLLNAAGADFTTAMKALTVQLEAASDEAAAALGAVTDEDTKDEIRAEARQIDSALNALVSLSIDSYIDAATGA
jgi:hypothetical protein